MMDNLGYRAMRRDDFDALHEMMSDWGVVRQLGGWPWPADPDLTRSRCQPYDGDGFVWAICVDDRLIGIVGVTRGDLGYALHPSFHGRGIISRASSRAVARAFRSSDRDHLTASTWHDNPTSRHLLAKLGFRHWQTRFLHARARGLPTIVHHHRLTRADRDRLRSTAQ